MSGYLEFGRVVNDSGDVFLGGTAEAYDVATKALSGDTVHILRIPTKSLPWLAKEVLSCLTEAQFDAVLNELEDEATAEAS